MQRSHPMTMNSPAAASLRSSKRLASAITRAATSAGIRCTPHLASSRRPRKALSCARITFSICVANSPTPISWASSPLTSKNRSSRLNSPTDHTPGECQWRNLATFRKCHASFDWSQNNEDFDAFINVRQNIKRQHAPSNRAAIAEICHKRGIQCRMSAPRHRATLQIRSISAIMARERRVSGRTWCA